MDLPVDICACVLLFGTEGQWRGGAATGTGMNPSWTSVGEGVPGILLDMEVYRPLGPIIHT